MSQRIAYLEHQLNARSAFAAISAESLAPNPDRASVFFAKKDAEYVAELQHELALAKAERERELFEVRLHGGAVGHGTLPLRLLARFIAPFTASIEHAAYRLHKGCESKNGIPISLMNALDLQLCGLHAGSARLMITGKLSPDLGGASVLENTLHQIFRLLEDNELFNDAVDAIGVKAVRKMAEAFKPLEESGSGIDIEWSAPNGTRHAWASDASTISVFRAKVERLGDPIILERVLTGTVRALRDTGMIELRDLEGRTLRIRYSLEQQPRVADLSLWQHVSVRVRTERTHDAMTERDIDRNHLIGVLA